MTKLLGKTVKQVAVGGNRLFEGIHNLATDQVLRRNHVLQVELQSFFQHVPLRLAVTFGDGDELFVELGVDFGGELLGRGWHGKGLLHLYSTGLERQIKVNLDSSRSTHNQCSTARRRLVV